MQERNGSDALRSRLSGIDWILLSLTIVAFFLLTWFRRHHAMLWNDEIMGWTTLAQPTWKRVIQVWWSGVDSSGIFFNLFARPWLQIFGWTELSLRLWSSTFVSLSLAVAWMTARRFAPLTVVAFGLPFVYLTNHTVVQQLNNGRTYGVLLLGVALVSYVLLRTDPADSPYSFWLPFLAFALLCGSHTLGVLFLCVFLGAFVLRDVLAYVLQWKIYLAALTAVLLVLPLSWKNIQADIDMGKPTFWTPKPTLGGLLLGFGDFSLQVLIVLAVALLVFLALRVMQPAERREPLVTRERLSLYCLLAVFPALELTMFALSLLGKSIFMDRYMIPIALGNAFLLCELMVRIGKLQPLPPRLQLGLIGIASASIVALFFTDLRRSGLPQRDYTTDFLAALPPGKCVVITDTSRFIEMMHYHSKDREMLSPTDWKIQVDPDFGGGGASFLHEMEDWKAMGIYADNIQPTEQILATHRSFIMVSDRPHTLWFRRYIQSNPAYRVKELAGYDRDRIWDVEPR
jgi:hypothetical protein